MKVLIRAIALPLVLALVSDSISNNDKVLKLLLLHALMYFVDLVDTWANARVQQPLPTGMSA